MLVFHIIYFIKKDAWTEAGKNDSAVTNNFLNIPDFLQYPFREPDKNLFVSKIKMYVLEKIKNVKDSDNDIVSPLLNLVQNQKYVMKWTIQNFTNWLTFSSTC